jgi:hypothetical protein
MPKKTCCLSLILRSLGNCRHQEHSCRKDWLGCSACPGSRARKNFFALFGPLTPKLACYMGTHLSWAWGKRSVCVTCLVSFAGEHHQSDITKLKPSRWMPCKESRRSAWATPVSQVRKCKSNPLYKNFVHWLVIIGCKHEYLKTISFTRL